MRNTLGRKSLAVGIILLFLGTCLIPAIARKIEKQSLAISDVIIVDNEGDGDYRSITEAISHSIAGDTIRVYSGTYRENIEINKPLILEGIALEYGQGNDTGKPIITQNLVTAVVTIESRDCSFTGFSILFEGTMENHIGIQLVNAPYTIISGNNISNCYRGINFTSDFLTQGCLIFKNNCSYCQEGIRIGNKNHVVYENKVEYSARGMTLWDARNCEIYKNIFIGIKTTDTEHNIGIDVADCVKVSVYSNHIENFSLGLYIPHSNLGNIGLPKRILNNDKNFLDNFLPNPTQVDEGKITRNLNSLKKPLSSNLSISRSINIHHNNFINNTENAFITYMRLPLFFSFISEGISLKEYGEIEYPRPFVLQNHFYENYWSDRQNDSNIYVIKGKFVFLFISYWIGLLYFLMFLHNPSGYIGFQLSFFDFHPVNEPYDIG